MAEQAQTFSPAALLEGFNRLDNTRKIWLMVALAAVIALVFGAVLWARTPTYRVLFSNVDGRDGGAILAQLSQLNVPYRMGDNGSSILVPEDVVYDTRLKLAAQGLPKGGSTGFELLDNPRLGISQFAEQINYQRALEGELSRTVESIGVVRSARVHLAIPRPSVFVREAQQASASVLVELERGRLLDAEQAFEKRGRAQRFLYAFLAYRADRLLDAEYLMEEVLADESFVAQHPSTLFYGARIFRYRGKPREAAELFARFDAAIASAEARAQETPAP